jgi:hypothetical protein
VFAITPDFRVVAPGANAVLTARDPNGATLTAPPVTTVSRNGAVATVSGLTVTGVAKGFTDVVGTHNAASDSSRIAVVPLDGFAVVVTRAQDSAYLPVSAGATFTVDLWLVRPTGGTADIGSIQGAIAWDPARFQYVSFTALAAGWSVFPNESSVGTGTVSYGAFSASGTGSTFALARLTLRAIGSASSSALTPTLTAAGSGVGANILTKLQAVPSVLRIQ